ncbi:MAG: hypothetical protein LIO74_11695 [Ruminococcus sp.]|nr:hypothetical protein [Ruminococcus sp.]
MKKVIVYILTILAALLFGGVLGNVCADISALSWLDITLPLHVDAREFHLYIADVTFGIDSKFNIVQLILTIIAILIAPKISSMIGKKG